MVFEQLKAEGAVGEEQPPTVELSAALAIQAGLLRKWGSTQGHCKNASAALALVLAEIGIPVAICIGTVTVDGAEHEHCWCRVNHLIIDATADQFGLHRGPLIGLENELPQYRENSFFLFQPREALELFRDASCLLDVTSSSAQSADP